MDSTSVVKVVAAFVAGLVVALGSALIYVRVSDIQHQQPSAQASVATATAFKQLPEAGNDTTPTTTTPAAMPQPTPESEPAAPITHRPRVYTDPNLVRAPRVIPIENTPAKPVSVPIQVAQNQVPPAPVPENTPTPVQSAPEYAPPVQQEQPATVPPSPQPHVVTLAAGTVVSLRLGETLSTDHNYTGDTFRGTLMAPIIQDGFVIADRGSKVLGRITNSQSAGHMANVAALSLMVTEISTTDGQKVAVQTTVFDTRGKSNVGPDAAKIAGGAALGAIIGGLAGGGKGAAIGAGAGGAAGTGAVLLTRGAPAVVQSETPLTFRLANPVTITEKLN